MFNMERSAPNSARRTQQTASAQRRAFTCRLGWRWGQSHELERVRGVHLCGERWAAISFADPGWSTRRGRPAPGSGGVQPGGRKSGRNFRRAEMTSSLRIRVGELVEDPGTRRPGVPAAGRPAGHGGDAPPRSRSRRHRQEEACGGEGKEAGPTITPDPRETEVSPRRALYPQIASQQNLTRVSRSQGIEFLQLPVYWNVSIPRSISPFPHFPQLDYSRVVYSTSSPPLPKKNHLRDPLNTSAEAVQVGAPSTHSLNSSWFICLTGQV